MNAARSVAGYEVSRDGTVFGVFDALGYVDSSLAPGTNYTCGVVAIDLAGLRSGTAGVRLTTPSNSAVAAPTGLRGEVYSTWRGRSSGTIRRRSALSTRCVVTGSC